ncbi:MAG: formate dehydrogenase subunit gamma [Ferrimicrobium sp.]|nr:formate dehydrogenase subunit gamma [Ferrimicrobium sp.]
MEDSLPEPMMMQSKVLHSYVPWSDELAGSVIKGKVTERGALLPILHGLSATFGYIDPRAIPLVAEALNLSEAEVFGVITFYKDFRSEPPGASVIRLCQAEACQSMGADRVAQHAKKRLGIGFGETTPDHAVTLEEVFCLGNCALSPAAMIDGRLVGRVDEERFDKLLGEIVTRFAGVTT